jgi:ferric-dicitrate binding protein FerR (iron transport regulator)
MSATKPSPYLARLRAEAAERSRHRRLLDEYEQVTRQLAEAKRELAEHELRARGRHPEQLRPHFEVALVGVALVALVALLIAIG